MGIFKSPYLSALAVWWPKVCSGSACGLTSYCWSACIHDGLSLAKYNSRTKSGNTIQRGLTAWPSCSPGACASMQLWNRDVANNDQDSGQPTRLRYAKFLTHLDNSRQRTSQAWLACMNVRTTSFAGNVACKFERYALVVVCSLCIGGLRAALSPKLLPRYRQAPNIIYPPLKGLA